MFRKLKYSKLNLSLISRIMSNIANEGSASVELPPDVFYNKVQETNRDLTIAVIREYQKRQLMQKLARKNIKPYGGLKILEALSATGLRSVRMAKEIPYIKRIFTNDNNPNAVKIIEKNIETNQVGHCTEACLNDAVQLMIRNSSFKDNFDIIDLDPYGTASPFLDSALLSIKDGGLLCVTCTDMAVLCGSAVGTSFGRYGCVTVRCSAIHEQGIRVLLSAIQNSASKCGKIIQPLISLSIDFYARVFVTIKNSPGKVKLISSKYSMMYSCESCYAFHLTPMGQVREGKFIPARASCSSTCDECSGNYQIAGPIWSDPIHDPEFVESVLSSIIDPKSVEYPKDFPIAENVTPYCEPIDYGSKARLSGILSLAKDELHDVPFYFIPDNLAQVITTTVPKSIHLRSAIVNAGYKVSESHCQPNSIKTNAPWSFIWELMRKVKLEYHPKKEQANEKKNHNLKCKETILSKPNEHNYKIDFTPNQSLVDSVKARTLPRFLPNPPNWGPKSRARADKSPIKNTNDEDLNDSAKRSKMETES